MMMIVATLLSGLLWLGGSGLHPVAALTWLAPIPLILASLRVRPRTALGATALAWLIGQLGLLGYYLGTLRLPVPAVAGVVLLGLGLAGGTVLLARALLLRGRIVTAVLTVPALWVLGEYGASRLLPNGAWWSLAYTQADVRPVIQLTALTGVWGVTYLLLAVPIALAALLGGLRPTLTTQLGHPRRALTCLLALLLSTGGWSAWSLSRSPDPAGLLTVGLVALRQPEDGLPLDEPSGRDLLTRYVPRVAGLVARGARVVVLPEKVFAVTDSTLPLLVDALRQTEARVVVGAVLRRAGTASNVALVLDPDGTITTYEKQHLVPGLEEWLTPGDDDVIVDGRFGVAICKDLDYPGLVRRYRARGATVLLVPALDFTSDGWLHGRMALVRGVENGLTVVRAAALGRPTVTDPGGRMLGEATAGDAELLVTSVPTTGWGTVYSRTGDWFALLSLVLLVVSLGGARRRRLTSAPRVSAFNS
ncbi:apolipoprotein N-acyltransferase [Micromonospora luteifusca]|uniref:Apolipoprotein N-acyltransferase n=1 Tax=Micromonospora luteifusca TaxID=709860 RepID=A0ABS2M2M4_9ACTN|nr:nitrilase-related carbon-nitrogen hydrolase [Micromonospora luteifusca]MBM7494713.1 apolipoprotein N-acyltransferase [Micromonospora luteifusca]